MDLRTFFNTERFVPEEEHESRVINYIPPVGNICILRTKDGMEHIGKVTEFNGIWEFVNRDGVVCLTHDDFYDPYQVIDNCYVLPETIPTDGDK